MECTRPYDTKNDKSSNSGVLKCATVGAAAQIESMTGATRLQQNVEEQPSEFKLERLPDMYSILPPPYYPMGMSPKRRATAIVSWGTSAILISLFIMCVAELIVGMAGKGISFLRPNSNSKGDQTNDETTINPVERKTMSRQTDTKDIKDIKNIEGSISTTVTQNDENVATVKPANEDVTEGNKEVNKNQTGANQEESKAVNQRNQAVKEDKAVHIATQTTSEIGTQTKEKGNILTRGLRTFRKKKKKTISPSVVTRTSSSVETVNSES